MASPCGRKLVIAAAPNGLRAAARRVFDATPHAAPWLGGIVGRCYRSQTRAVERTPEPCGLGSAHSALGAGGASGYGLAFATFLSLASRRASSSSHSRARAASRKRLACSGEGVEVVIRPSVRVCQPYIEKHHGSPLAIHPKPHGVAHDDLRSLKPQLGLGDADVAHTCRREELRVSAATKFDGRYGLLDHLMTAAPGCANLKRRGLLDLPPAT